MSETRIIGISGNNGSGKDTFGSLLYRSFERKGIRVKKMAFADNLYFICNMLFNTPPKTTCDANPVLKDQVMSNGKTVRQILIETGYKMREIYADCWVDLLLRRCAFFKGVVIITDVRFDNEAAICHDLIQIIRDRQGENVGKTYGECIVNNGTLDDLARIADEYVERYK